MLTSKIMSIGRIALQTEGGYITRLFLPCEAPSAPEPPVGSLAESAFCQLHEYLEAIRCDFDLPLAAPQGTPLQRNIMHRLSQIPYGCTVTYAALGPARTVGSVCAGNPLPILRPCHRVLPAHNPPGHYRGGTQLKARLLELEKELVTNYEVPVDKPGGQSPRNSKTFNIQLSTFNIPLSPRCHK